MTDRFPHPEMADELDKLAQRTARREWHGMRRTPEYGIWCAMKTRCLNPNSVTYERYGGAGIEICDEWAQSFTTFLKDMGRRPSSRHSVDRIDNRLGYSPENCRWATPKMQSRNRERCFLVVEGVRKPLRTWAKEAGIAVDTIRRRLKAGETPQDAVRPPTPRGERNHAYFSSRRHS